MANYPILAGTLAALAPTKMEPLPSEDRRKIDDVLVQTRNWMYSFLNNYFSDTTGLKITAFPGLSQIPPQYIRGTNPVDKTGRELAQGTVQSEDFANLVITTKKFARNAVTSEGIAVGHVREANLHTHSVTTPKIAPFIDFHLGSVFPTQAELEHQADVISQGTPFPFVHHFNRFLTDGEVLAKGGNPATQFGVLFNVFTGPVQESVSYLFPKPAGTPGSVIDPTIQITTDRFKRGGLNSNSTFFDIQEDRVLDKQIGGDKLINANENEILVGGNLVGGTINCLAPKPFGGNRIKVDKNGITSFVTPSGAGCVLVVEQVAGGVSLGQDQFWNLRGRPALAPWVIKAGSELVSINGTAIQFKKAGFYLIIASVPAFNVGKHRARILIKPDGNNQINTIFVYGGNSSSASVAQTRSIVISLVSVLETNPLANMLVYSHVETANTTNGGGRGTGSSSNTDPEVFTQIFMLKIK